MSGLRRVVVTGVGMVTPVGLDTAVSWDAFVEGRSGIGPITQFDASEFATKIAGEVDGFDPEQWIEPKEVKKMDRFIHFAMASSRMALDSSGLEVTEENAPRVGVIVGAGMGGLPAIEHYHKLLLERGPARPGSTVIAA